jgi:hypothetical protein
MPLIQASFNSVNFKNWTVQPPASSFKTMNNENILFEFLEKIWNGKDTDSVEKYVNPEYTIHIDTGDPWEGKTIGPDEFKARLIIRSILFLICISAYYLLFLMAIMLP